MDKSATCWLRSLPMNTFLDNFDAAKNTWKTRFVFTSMGPNTIVNDRWKPNLPKRQSSSMGLAMWANAVTNARYIPTRITRTICNPDPLMARRSLLLMIVAVRQKVMKMPKPHIAASVAPYKLPHVKNVWGISAQSNCFSSIGHCLSEHSSQVSLSTRNSLFRHG